VFGDGQFADWAQVVIDEMAVFPKGKYSDLTDSVTQTINYFRGVGLGITDETVATAEREAARRTPRIDRPIYPA
jgi:hypothetical protein